VHILHYISSVRLESGGPAEGLRRIIDGYIYDGHTAEVLTFDGPDERLSNEIPVPVHAIGPTGTKYGYNARAIPWLQANRSRFDGVVVHGLWQYQGLSAMLAIKPPQRYAIFTHGMLDPWFNRRYPLKYCKKMPYWLSVERCVLGSACRVLFTSATEQDLAARSFPFSHWRGQVVPYGTAGPPPNAEAQRDSFYRLCPQLRHRSFILFAARIHEKKGCDLLVEAYAQVSKRFQVPWLVIAGPDQMGLQASLQSEAKRRGVADKILWPGMIVGDVKWGAFRACEAFVLPSHQENFGIAVAEALSCGKPVLISDQVNICGQIRENSAGIVAPDTLEGTVSLLEQWMVMSESHRKKVTENAMATFRRHFDTQETSRAIASLFQGSSSSG
jgi:glycosyltransferase involved in cell wall biosynthesis